MARNGTTGAYTVPNSFSPGDTVASSKINENYSDLGDEITNSVAADGQTSMSGPLKAANGSAATPSITFSSDQNTGIYRKGSNNLAVVCDGSDVIDVTTSGANVIGSITQNGIVIRPVGEMTDFAGSSVPSGWLLCDGSAKSRTTYAALFAAIGTTYGSGDGSTTFNLPDCTGRVTVGKEATATRLTTSGGGVDGGTLGAVGGGQNATLLTANLPPYTPAGSISTLALNFNSGYNGIPFSPNTSLSGSSSFFQTNSTGGITSTATFGTQTFTGTAQGGTSTPVKVVQPTIVVNKIIFAGV